jgi:RNA polymerase sigma factor (TIGR02999 family)
MADVTELLARWKAGDEHALENLMPVVYGELRRLAEHYMRAERTGHTLQPTALVHEAYLRLVSTRDPRFENRVHFYGAAARAMRRILVDHARQRGARKRSRSTATIDLDRVPAAAIEVSADLVALDASLDRLAAIASRAARVVELRYFGGLSIGETAAFLAIGPATVKRHWTFARAWLYRDLTGEEPRDP